MRFKLTRITSNYDGKLAAATK